MTPRYPDIKVKLVGEDGNAFAIIGRVTRALRRHGIDGAEVDQFLSECRSGDYDHLLATCMEWVDCD
jgi:hypothetical protein